VREVAVSLPAAHADRVARELERHGRRVVLRAFGAEELEAAVASAGASVGFEAAVVGAGSAYLDARLLATCDTAGVRLVALAVDAGERRNAVELGLHEVIDAEAEWRELEEYLDAGIGIAPAIASRVAPAVSHEVGPTAPPMSARRGEVIAVWGPAGAPGRTTIAIAIAAELAAEGHSVALADADTHSGAVAPTLGLLDEAPGFAAACRLAGNDALTIPELERIGERYLSPHGSFWVLTGIGRPHRWPELSGERVTTTLALCREWVDYTIVDTGFSLENDEEISSDLFGPRRNAATISALREADRVVAVGSGDPVGLSRFLRAHVDLLEVVEAERVTTVMNRIRGSVIGLNPSGQVEQTLRRFGGIVSPVLVPHDQPALDAAILAGKTLRDVAAKSPARLAISRFVASQLSRRAG
jgi:MinD-like ATPase involved in chromosome partitioning or flagellar assembly